MENYTVTVTGRWADPRTKLETRRTETYRVAARFPADAQMAGGQLFARTAFEQRCQTIGDCRAEALADAR